MHAPVDAEEVARFAAVVWLMNLKYVDDNSPENLLVV